MGLTWESPEGFALMSTAVQRRANLAVQNVYQQYRSAPCEPRQAGALQTSDVSQTSEVWTGGFALT